MGLWNAKTEKVLVEWGSLGVLEVLRDRRGHRYLSYSLDISSEDETETYLVTKVTNEDLIGLMECKVPLYDLLKKNKYCWLDDGLDQISVPISIIKEEVLPIKDSCFEDNREWKDYIEKIRTEI